MSIFSYVRSYFIFCLIFRCRGTCFGEGLFSWDGRSSSTILKYTGIFVFIYDFWWAAVAAKL